MMASKDRFMRAPLWLIGAVLLLPLGTAYSQDYEAVERRLGQLVAEGAISLDQAKVMMDALRRVGKKPDEDRGRRQKMEAVGRKIREAVAAGKITPEEGRAKMEAFRKQMSGGEKKRITREEYAKAEAELKKMVKAGKISGKEAKKKLQWMRQRMAEPQEKKRDVDAEALRKRLERAVREGHLTEEEAKAKWRKIMGERKGKR
jgi:polyhydroxyalkanoate synthesis regulator phasin